jgi:hypothetical protein
VILALAARARSALVRRLLGVSAEEIRYTFEDVRRELRAARAEIAALRRQVERLEGGSPEGEEKEQVGRARRRRRARNEPG